MSGGGYQDGGAASDYAIADNLMEVRIELGYRFVAVLIISRLSAARRFNREVQLFPDWITDGSSPFFAGVASCDLMPSATNSCYIGRL